MEIKKLLPIAVIAILAACNSKKEKQTVTGADTTTTPATSPTNTTNTATTLSGSGNLNYTVNDTARSLSASALVSKDKDKLSPGNDMLAVLTGSGSGDETLTVNFLFALKPGSYPVVGLGMTRPNQVFGGILGGKAALTKYKVNLTEVTDLGSNNMGGHRWKLSGSIDEEVIVDAMSLMKLDPNHPAAIKLNKISFSSITFEDNMEELMNKLKSN